MPTTTYNKLVRDYIPQIIEKSGKNCTFELLTSEKYYEMLKTKLLEETNEYLDSGEISELADLLEVVYALLGCHETTPNELENIRIAKREQRGGFEKRIFLKEVED